MKSICLVCASICLLSSAFALDETAPMPPSIELLIGSFGTNKMPVLRASNVEPESLISIYSDPHCTHKLGSARVEIDHPYVDITVSLPPGTGEYRFYANAMDTAGNISYCNIGPTYNLLPHYGSENLEICTVKQKNAASFAFAQNKNIAVQEVNVANYLPGPWTEMTGNNTGVDSVVIVATIKGIVKVRAYAVEAHQIGSSSDCKILSVSALGSY